MSVAAAAAAPSTSSASLEKEDEQQQPPRLNELLDVSLKRTRELFTVANDVYTFTDEPHSQKVKLLTKYRDEYAMVQTLPAAITQKANASKQKTSSILQPLPSAAADAQQLLLTGGSVEPERDATKQLPVPQTSAAQGGALMLRGATGTKQAESGALTLGTGRMGDTRQMPKPAWHAPWKLMRVISGHLGWVRSVTVDVSNEWFATGAGDRTIKIWDLASGQLRLTLTGHISPVRGLAVSSRHPYLFSCGEDKQIKCWDLETNKVVRQYHGHLSGVYCMSLHPTLDVLVTGGRDSTARVWDMRTKAQVMVLTGHQNTVSSVVTQAPDPQIITGSMDSTVRLWDLAAGRSMGTLTHHKKSVRALCMHPHEYTFASGSADNIKQWKLPEAQFVQNCSGHQGIVNCLAVNEDNVFFSGGDNGSMHFWDWRTGYNFQSGVSQVQPGSLESEAGIFACTFDRSGSRLITCEADKSIKVWREDDQATPETHPVRWKADLKRTRY
ncbi:pre-mRNA-splicing factor prp46 [Sorochytrium milnesiophthora]